MARDLAKRSIEFVENAQPRFHRSTGRQSTEPRLRVMLGDRDGRKLLHQLVYAHAAAPGDFLHSVVGVIGQMDGQG